MSLGADGPFTGAAVVGGHPVFFRERCLHKVFGQMPSNFQVQTNACRGVEKGSGRSTALVGEVLYYKSSDGICAYDGSLPRVISQNLGTVRYRNAVAGVLGSKYYVSMEEIGGGWTILVCDTEKNLWHREDDLHALILQGCREDLFCADDKGNLWSLAGTAGTVTEQVSWMAQTEPMGVTLPGNRYLQKLELSLLLEPGSRISVQAEYDSCGIWETLGSLQGMSLRSFLLPVLPRRCDHFCLRLLGQGPARLFSVTKVLSPGGKL